MTEERQIWLGREGQEFGPYAESLVRQWVAAGQVTYTTLAWCEGMPAWRPLGELLGVEAPTPARPPLPPGPPDLRPAIDPARASLPEPPSMHWFLVLVLCFLTLGVFGIVWPFIQAAWVRRVDPRSKAIPWLVAALVATLAYWAVALASGIAGAFAGNTDAVMWGPMMSLGTTLSLLQFAFMVLAYFSMAGSLRRELPRYGLVPQIGGVTLFFFTMLYFQGQLTWIAQWRQTGKTQPSAPKVVFWILGCIPFVLGLLMLLTVFGMLYSSGGVKF
ncbi:DUF4339 domain-containing protein [Luteibacter sp. PPL554]|jgi:hypothetical protein